MNIDKFFNKAIYVLIALLMAVSLVICSFFIQPFVFGADGLAPLTVYSSTPSYSDVVSSGILIYNTGSYDVFACASTDYVFVVYDTSLDVYYGVCESSGAKVYRNNSANALSLNLRSYDSTYSLYYDQIGNGGTAYCSSYDGKDACLSAVRDFIDNGYSSLTASPATIVVRPGNVAYIGYNEGYCNLSVRLSNAVKTYSSNTRIGFSASRPAEGSTLYYDNSTGNSVSWSNSQPRDILGRSTYFIYHETLNSVGYFIIYNPAYDDAGNINNVISAEFSAYTSVVQFPLTSSLVDGSVVSTGNSDEFYMSEGVDMMSTPGVPTYIYTGTDGTTSSAIEVPASQYNYYAPEENEEGLLAGFVQRIVQLLSAPVKHIQNLFNEGLTFMTWLSGLWSWLPVEVVGILTSALIVLIVVGVIKVFWK